MSDQASRFFTVEHDGLGIRAFQRWALGDLVDNRNRGIFAEWLVGKALQIIGDGDVRKTWDAYDLLYGNVKIEVKASGLSQGWNVDSRSNPRFDIGPRKWTWLESEDQWIENDPPARPADVYVFCLHKSEEATNENVADPHCWQFWVLSTRKLDDQLGQQKSVGLATLDRLTERILWSDIKAGVDGCVQKVTR